MTKVRFVFGFSEILIFLSAEIFGFHFRIGIPFGRVVRSDEFVPSNRIPGKIFPAPKSPGSGGLVQRSDKSGQFVLVNFVGISKLISTPRGT